MSQTVNIGTEQVGARIYVTGNSYPIRDKLKSAGCHWDGERKQWWIGTAKAEKIAGIVGQLDGQEVAENLDDRRVHGKVKYKDRSYYCIAVTDAKLRLITLDGKIDFWAQVEQCVWEKHYQPRQKWGGYGRGQVTIYTTVGSLRRFIAEQKNPATARGQCTECGSWGPKGEPCQDCGGEGHHV